MKLSATFALSAARFAMVRHVNTGAQAVSGVVERLPPIGREPIESPVMDYELKISRRTVDKLGVRLYDKVSAVVAELVANAYDADAESVTVRLPLNTELARRDGSKIRDKDYVIEVRDDGHGMKPIEAQEFYLKVGRDRRSHPEQGSHSRQKKRPVMGRKGIGKLAPFGVCRRIEVVSSGGDKTSQGYLTSHFYLDYQQIDVDEETPVPLESGSEDQTYRRASGTVIRLSNFLPKRVPDKETFMRQIARRFGPTCEMRDFRILVIDSRQEGPSPEQVTRLNLPQMRETEIDVSDRPVILEDGTTRRVTGFLAFSRHPYKHEETGGVAIYARGKIVATTRDFGQPAGFTGEFAARSYLIGELQADWLDQDEDLVRTDRQDILWDSALGRALTGWGRTLLKEIARRGREPRRTKVRKAFLEASQIEEKARDRFVDEDVVASAVELARAIGGFAAEDELASEEYVSQLREVILSVAPHHALMEAFRKVDSTASIEDLIGLSGKTYVAELASYSQIALERIKAIRELERVIGDESSESKLQAIIARWPWLIEPTWAAITSNQELKTFRDQLKLWLQQNRNVDADVAISQEKKRPDFTLINIGREIRLVELKACGHRFDDKDWERLVNYADALDGVFESSEDLASYFPEGWRIELVADDVKISNSSFRRAYKGLQSNEQLQRRNWQDFLARAKKANELFLNVSASMQDGQF